MTTPNHFINVLTFPHLENVNPFGFYTEKKEGQVPLRKSEFPIELWASKKQELINIKYLYCDFSSTEGCKYVTDVNLKQSIHFAKHYYNHLIFEYFKNVADIVFPNYVQSSEVWFKNTKESNNQYNVYLKYTLAVQIALISNNPEIVVSFNGTSKVLKKSVHDLVNENIDTHNFNWLVNKGVLVKYENLPTEANNYLSEYFPVLNPELANALHFPPIPPKRTDKKYQDYFFAVNQFQNEYLNNPEFLKIIPHTGKWVELAEEKVCITTEGTNLLKFGKGTHTDPYEGLKTYKPCVPVPPGHYKFFFICHESDKETAELFHKYSKKEKGFINFRDFLSLPITYDKEKHILFKDINNPLPEIEEKLSQTELPPDTHYLAIYISPYNKYENDPEKRNFYYQIKQVLLRYKISSQVIYNQNINKENFKYSVSNIAVAILAKLGGIPWRLDRELNNELIVGIGAFKTRKFDIKYIGSTFCFSNNGIFKGFDSFPAENNFLLAGKIRKVIEAYQKENTKAERLIIHFYKRMSQKEIKPIVDQLLTLKLNIPLIIVSVNKTASNDIVLFDADSPLKMPYSGTYLPVGNNNYLLCNNSRYKPVIADETYSYPDETEITQPEKELKSYPLPVKLHIQSTVPGILRDQEQIKLLIDQVYQFSRMYWKSVSQQSLPVTTRYPEMVAQIFPYFKGGKIPEFGKNNLWFL